MSKVFFQIGTNTGYDQFRENVKFSKPDRVILVEPNRELVPEITKNYKDISGVRIYNNAIYYENNKNVDLFIPKLVSRSDDSIMGMRAANGCHYNNEHYTLCPLNDWGDSKDEMTKITAEGITFDEICRRENITEIEYLQIDTEGFDTEIIKMIDLKKYKIHRIRFEKWEFNSEQFSKFNSNIEGKNLAKKLGNAGLQDAINKLIENNYVLIDVQDLDGNDKLAILLC